MPLGSLGLDRLDSELGPGVLAEVLGAGEVKQDVEILGTNEMQTLLGLDPNAASVKIDEHGTVLPENPPHTEDGNPVDGDPAEGDELGASWNDLDYLRQRHPPKHWDQTSHCFVIADNGSRVRCREVGSHSLPLP